MHNCNGKTLTALVVVLSLLLGLSGCAAEPITQAVREALQQAVQEARTLQEEARFRDAIAMLDSVRANEAWSSDEETLYKQLLKSETNRIVELCRVQVDRVNKFSSIFSLRDESKTIAFGFFPNLWKNAEGKGWFLHLRLYHRDDGRFGNQVTIVVDGTPYSTSVKKASSGDVLHDVDEGWVLHIVNWRPTDEGSETLFRAVANYTGTLPLKVEISGDEDPDEEYILRPADVQAWRDLLFLYDHLEEADYPFAY